MKKVTTAIEDYLYEFYNKIGEDAGGIKPEKVMTDALLKLAGELSLNAISEKAKKIQWYAMLDTIANAENNANIKAMLQIIMPSILRKTFLLLDRGR